MQVRGYGHRIDQYGINTDTDQHEESLKCQGEQAFQIVVPDIAPLLIGLVANGIGATEV